MPTIKIFYPTEIAETGQDSAASFIFASGSPAGSMGSDLWVFLFSVKLLGHNETHVPQPIQRFWSTFTFVINPPVGQLSE